MLHKVDPAAQPGLLRQHDLRLHADPSRVVLRPFHLSWQARESETSRAAKLVSDVLALSEEQGFPFPCCRKDQRFAASRLGSDTATRPARLPIPFGSEMQPDTGQCGHTPRP